MRSKSQATQPRRKRLSSRVNTHLLGLTGLSALFVLTGCENTIQAHGYTSLESCLEARVYTEWECEDKFEQAQKMHTELAPQYARLEDCQADYGIAGCEMEPDGSTASSGTTGQTGTGYHSSGGFFTPLLLGYMMGKLGGHTSPLYRSSRQGLVTPAGQTVPSSAFNPAGTQVKQNSFKAPPRRSQFRAGQTVSSRGGFGRTGRKRSFGS